VHPIRITVADDLARSRLTVFFRLLLAIPHFIWLLLWTIAALFAAIANWIVTLVTGRPPAGLHRFLSRYVRYGTHVYAYLTLAANPFPGFTGDPGSYPIDLEVDPPERQSRWVTGFRLLLALPALLLVSTIGGGGGSGGRGYDDDGYSWAYQGGGVLFTIAFFAWFACLARGRMPHGFRNALAWGLRYSAQVAGYVLVLTDRYPHSEPWLPVEAGAPPAHPIGIGVDDDRRRSRLTVFFRFLLALPHLVWFTLWTIAAWLAAIAAWFATLALGRTPDALHRFLAAYVRYQIHLDAYLWLVANPFPGFTGAPGYPVELDIAPPERQSRWVTGFRLFLAVPALAIVGALWLALIVAAFLGWFASLVTGRMPEGFRDLGVWVLRYWGQVNAYLYLLTDRYPYSGPPVEELPEPEEPALAAAAA
jgi:Domain of unknown function (DUF4389)